MFGSEQCLPTWGLCLFGGCSLFSPAAFCQSESLLSSQELGLLQEYLLALTTEDHLLRCAAQVPSPLSPKSWTVASSFDEWHHITCQDGGGEEDREEGVSCLTSPDPPRVYMELGCNAVTSFWPSQRAVEPRSSLSLILNCGVRRH